MTAIASNMVRQGLNAFIEEVERQDDLTPDEARQLLSSVELPILFLDRLWALANGFLDQGMEESNLKFLIKEFGDVTELGIKAFTIAREKVMCVRLTEEEKQAGLSMLASAIQRCEQMRAALSDHLDWLETAFKEVDLASLAPAQGEQNARGFVGMDDVLKGLLSGQ